MMTKLITRSCLRLLSLGRKVKSPGVCAPGLLGTVTGSPECGQHLASILPNSSSLHKPLDAIHPRTTCRRLTAGHAVKPDTVGLCASGKTGQDGSQHSSRGSDKLRPSSVEAAATRAPRPLQGSTRVRRSAYVSSFLRGSLAYAETCGIQGQSGTRKPIERG